MNVQSLSALLVAILTFSIGLSLLLRDRAQPVYRRFAAFCFSLVAWNIAIFLAHTTESEWAFFMSTYAAVILPVFAARFFQYFLSDERRPQSPLTPRSFIGLTLGITIAITYTAVFRDLGLHRPWLFRVAIGAYVVWALLATTTGIYRKYRRTLTPGEKTSLLYLFVTSSAAVVLVAAQPLPVAGPFLNAAGNILTIVVMYFLSQTLLRFRLLDVKELNSKMAVLSTLMVLASAVYALLNAWVSRDQIAVFFFNTLVASFVILTLFEPLRVAIERPIQKWFFRERYELRARLEPLRSHLANVIDVREAIRVVLASIEGSERVTHASFYLLDSTGSGYDLVGHIGPRPVERIDAVARRVFFERMITTRQPIYLEQLEREYTAQTNKGDSQAEALDAIARVLSEMNAALCLPLVEEDQVVGLFAVRDERVKDAYGRDEIELFQSIAAQLSLIVQNSKLYDRMKERDRLAALGQMAAGLAHEIRNPLGAIKGAAQLLAPVSSTENLSDSVPTEAQQFLAIIVEETNRLNRVVSQFLDYARPLRSEFHNLDINEVVQKTIQLVLSSGDSQKRHSVQFHVSLDETLPKIKGDAEQLRQVFLNLAINAIQAMDENGVLTVSTSRRKLRRPRNIVPISGSEQTTDEMLEIHFRDTGSGIPQAAMRNLFIPFFTTKEKGTGLGLPISQRIIENHGGTIEVRTQAGIGTTFTVILPVLDAAHQETMGKKIDPLRSLA